MTNWVDVIVKLADERWARGKPLFLAQIPPELQKHGIDLDVSLAGRSLRETISVEAADKVRLVTDPDRKLVWAVIPHAVQEDLDLRPFFEPSSKIAAIESNYPRYKRSFFAAFIKTIPPNHKRWITAKGFIDLPEGAPRPTGALEFDASDTISIQPDEPIDIEAVHTAIGKWAQRTGANVADFYAEVSTLGERDHKSRVAKTTLDLAALNEEDVRRIMVPLDVVLKLLRH